MNHDSNCGWPAAAEMLRIKGLSQRGTGGPFEGLEQQEEGSSLPLSHRMLLLANPSRQG